MLEIEIKRLKGNGVFARNVRFDVTPKIIMKPRFVAPGGNVEACKETQGFSFYIEYMQGLPAPILMLLKTFNFTTKTIAEITDAPQAMLEKAVKEGAGQDVMGMYPINGEVESWIKKELEL